MTPGPRTRRGQLDRCGQRASGGRRTVAGAGAAVAALALAACTASGAGAGTGGAASPAAAPGTAASPTGAPSAGRYPVASAQPAVTATPSVSAGGYELVSAGDPVRVLLPGVDVLVTVSGPDVSLPEPSPGQPVTAASAPGVLTVTLVPAAGSAPLPVRASDFLGLDEQQTAEALVPDAATATASPGHPVTMHLASDFRSGHTTLTWQPLGRPVVTWDFVVEID